MNQFIREKPYYKVWCLNARHSTFCSLSYTQVIEKVSMSLDPAETSSLILFINSRQISTVHYKWKTSQICANCQVRLHFNLHWCVNETQWMDSWTCWNVDLCNVTSLYSTHTIIYTNDTIIIDYYICTCI